MTAPTPARHLVVLDVESNGLDVDTHDVWELAWWNLTTGDRDAFFPYIGDGRDFLHAAELDALRVNRFVDRWTPAALEANGYSASETKIRLRDFVEQCWPLDSDTCRSVLVCAQPKFDLPLTSKTLRRNNIGVSKGRRVDQYQPWFHRAVDFASYTNGVLGIDPSNPQSASSTAAILGVSIAPEERHTAAGDVTLVGRSMLLLRWLARTAPRWTLGDLDRVLADAPRGTEIDGLIGRA